MCAKIVYGFYKKICTPYVRYLMKKVKETGILIDKPKRENPKTVRTPENIAVVAESVCEAPSTLIHFVLYNRTFRKHRWDEFCIKTLVWRHTKFNWFRSWRKYLFLENALKNYWIFSQISFFIWKYKPSGKLWKIISFKWLPRLAMQ